MQSQIVPYAVTASVYAVTASALISLYSTIFCLISLHAAAVALFYTTSTSGAVLQTTHQAADHSTTGPLCSDSLCADQLVFNHLLPDLLERSCSGTALQVIYEAVDQLLHGAVNCVQGQCSNLSDNVSCLALKLGCDLAVGRV